MDLMSFVDSLTALVGVPVGDISLGDGYYIVWEDFVAYVGSVLIVLTIVCFVASLVNTCRNLWKVR